MGGSTLKVLIMAGGTGGHVFPALAVARQLQSQGVSMSWLGTARGIEARLVPEAHIDLHLLPVQGVRGRGTAGLLKAPVLVSRAVWRALKLVRQINPDLVLGFGGFASGPGGIAARLAGRPLIIHEQNAVAGTTNRLLSRFATRVLSAFPDVFPGADVVGNPIRADIAQLPGPEERLARRDDGQGFRLLVLGGSLGAQALNELVPKGLAKLAPEQRPQVRHQAGRDRAQACRELYQQLEVEAQVDEFIGDMAGAYGWADMVICRAGALTVSELMAVGVAALLVPYPHAIDDHQSRNAEVLEKAGAARVVAQKNLDAETLAALLTSDFGSAEQRIYMARRGRQLAQPEAAEKVAQHCLEVARG